jgi:hypothetical protein
MSEFDFPALIITVLYVSTTPMALSALHGAAHMNVNLALTRDFHAIDLDPFNITRIDA